MGGSKDVTGLFTTKGGTIAHHGGVHVLIAHRRAVEDAAAILPGPFKPEVGHHRGHQTLVGQIPLVLQHGAPEIQRVITIQDPSPPINGQHAVGITIEGEAHGRSTVEHRLAKRGQLRGATSNIDPGAVGFSMENRQVGAESPEALLPQAVADPQQRSSTIGTPSRRREPTDANSASR